MTGFGLATLNACFNASAFVLMVLGYRAIKAGERETHKRFMLAAFAASCLFLTSYLTRIALFGDTNFQGEGTMRIVYFAILVSHVILALATAPLVLVTLNHGLRGSFERHRRIAKITFPIWAYVSVTGVIVYVLLYHW